MVRSAQKLVDVLVLYQVMSGGVRKIVRGTPRPPSVPVGYAVLKTKLSELAIERAHQLKVVGDHVLFRPTTVRA